MTIPVREISVRHIYGVSAFVKQTLRSSLAEYVSLKI